MVFVQLDEKELADLQNKFDSLTFKEQQGAIKGALSASASILKRQTKANIKSAPFKKNKDLTNGVKHKNRVMSVEKSFATVYLFSWNRILEGGTKERVTKKGYNRGTINGSYFFRDAKAQTQDQVFSAMETNLLKSIHKRWNKNQ